jgi:hypothetical protein
VPEDDEVKKITRLVGDLQIAAAPPVFTQTTMTKRTMMMMAKEILRLRRTTISGAKEQNC